MKNAIIISGPTATGKTQTAINTYHLLKQNGLKSIIINYDSLLFYKNLDIGTAKPSDKELKKTPHEMINISEIDTPINASIYEKKTKDVLAKYDDEVIPIFVGGSAFYIRALIKGMYETEEVSNEIKLKSEELFKTRGISAFIEILKDNDPQSYETLHENDHYRIIRAVEFFWQSGKPISLEKQKESDPYNFNINQWDNLNFLHIYLDLPRDEHYKFILKRTATMLDSGLIDEVEKLLKVYSGKEKPLQSIGYKEVQGYLEGSFSSIEELSERISISTRQLAKAQRTFYKKIRPKTSFHPIQDKQKILDTILTFLNK